jgi:hypothetical protein
MYPHGNQTPSVAKWQDLHRLRIPTIEQLDNIKSHLDLVILALEAIAHITSETILQAATTLELDSVIKDRVELWRLRQANPWRKSNGGRKKLDVEEARSLVLIICHLAKQEQELLRRAVSLLEQVTAQNQEPHKMALLGDYLDKFTNLYQERMAEETTMNTEQLYQLALKLLVDLLFYSGKAGHRLLWLAILGQRVRG